MVREPDATMQPTPQDNQLLSKHRILSFKPQLRLEWQGQDGQSETEQPDHSASLGDSITASTRTRFSVHTMAIRKVHRFPYVVTAVLFILISMLPQVIGLTSRESTGCSSVRS
jgi:hypothetical protein